MKRMALTIASSSAVVRPRLRTSLQLSVVVLVGCNSVGWTEHVGVMRGLVEGQVKLGAWKETLKNDPTRLMEAYLASAQAQNAWTGAQDERRR